MDYRLRDFEIRLRSLFKLRRGRTNLLPHQQRALASLQNQRDFLIAPCDKNLGPAIIQTEDYVQMAFRDHLNDRTTYQALPPTSAATIQTQLLSGLNDWLRKHKSVMTKMERKFLRSRRDENNSPFARFYLTLKAHKLKAGEDVRHLKSRPIVSCPGSLLHPLGVWVDRKLQTVAQLQRSYFKNSFALKQQLLELELPPNARLFTADAVSMYTNIPTAMALNVIRQTLNHYRLHSDSEYPAAAVCDGLKLVMRHNVFTFGDMLFKQLNGTAMGTPPAPPYATLYYSSFEDSVLDTFRDNILFYRRFIDDVIGVYLCDPDPEHDQDTWSRLQAAMNRAPGLTWEFSDLSQQVDFMDLTLRIDHGRITTTLYEKPLNLHLYIPPHSAHPPGLLPGIIFGTLFRIYTLCSSKEDTATRTKIFFQRLLARGYKAEKIRPLFLCAIETAKNYSGPADGNRDKDSFIIFHLPFHPNDPASYEIQRAWRECIAEPQYKMPVWNIPNPKTRQRCGIKRMIIAYRRPMNLGNLLSHRNLDTVGPPVSSYYQPD